MSEFVEQAILSLGVAVALLWSIETRQRLLKLEKQEIFGGKRQLLRAAGQQESRPD